MAMEYEHRGGGGGGGNCLWCCFGRGGGGAAGEEEDAPAAARMLRTSSRWLRERAEELPELVARIGRRRRLVAGEFRYDPISYALNFDEDGAAEADAADEPFTYRGFSSRLPPSPAPASAEPANPAPTAGRRS